MDRLSSPTAIASPASTRLTSSAQTTYTTAGTVYKPNSTQPLQPPTRRGRAFKWANGGLHPELSLLPKSVLATLPLRGAVNRAAVLQQYSPLQQNYAKAVSPSPFSDHDHGLAKMHIQGPATGRTDDSSVLSTLFAGSSSDDRSPSQCEESETDDSDEEDVGMDPLAGMPFKSLQNLASYPNPMQQRARKALNVTKPIIQVSEQKFDSAYLRPVGSPPKGPQKGDAEGDASFRPPPGLAQHRLFQHMKPTTTTLADGPGAPRPLTAGPPGQRQHRLANVDAHMRTLQAKSKENIDTESNASDCTTPYYAQAFGWDQWSQYRPSPVPRVDSVMGRSSINDEGNPAKDLGWPPIKVSFSEQGTPVFASFPDASDTATGKDDSTLENPTRQRLSRFVPGTDRLTKAEIKACDERNNAVWHAGQGLLNKSTAEAIGDARFRRFEQNHGVIGDGRPSKKATVYTPMSIAEAKALPTAHHAKPLLNVAFDTLLRYRDENWKRSMAAPGQVEDKTSRFV